MPEFSKLLRRRRQEAHLTQAELAQRVGVKQQSVARWERGASSPNRDTLTSIARAFGEPDDDWVRFAGRNAASDRPRLLHPVRSQIDRLPLGELTPSEFERFTSYLLAACYRGDRVTRVGGQGHAQGGADILVRTSDGLHLFQCKRLKRFGVAQMRAAAQAAAATAAERRVLVLSRVASQDARDEAGSVGWDIWDHDDIVRMLQQELSSESARRVLKVFFPGWEEDFLGIRGAGPWALADEFFAGQSEESPFSHAYALIGREEEVEKVLEWARGDRPFFLLTGAGGVGKSRFLMEVARRIDDDAGRPVVYCVDQHATVDLEDFRRFGDDRPFIVVDDAHGQDDLAIIIRGARARSERQRRARVLFATREYGKPRLMRELAEHAHELDPPTVALAPLARSDARLLASHVLGTPEMSPLTMRLVGVTRDCTLFLVAAGYLLKTKRVDPAFLDDEEGFRVVVLERMYHEYVRGAGHLPGDIDVADVLQFLAAVHPFDLDDNDALEAASHVLGCRRDVLTSALGEIVRTGVVVKRRSRLRVQPDLLADHILVKACFNRTLGKATGYADRIWQAGSAGLRRNLIVNVARIDWRLSETGMSPDSMLAEAWHVLDQEFKEGGILKRLDLLNLLEKVAFYQPERTLSLVEWALDHELPPERNPFGQRKYEHVRVRVAPVLRVCAYRRESLYRACELLWHLARSERRPTNPYPDHPVRILCDLAAYSRYKPFDHARQVISQAIEWLFRDRVRLVFDILDQALQKEVDDHVSDGHTVTFDPYSTLELGKERVLALRADVLAAVIQQFLGGDESLAVRGTKSFELALSPPGGLFGRKPDEDETTVWQVESLKLLKRIQTVLDGAVLSAPVAVALREAVDSAMWYPSKDVTVVAEEVMSAIGDDLDHQVVEMLIHGPWRRFGRHEKIHAPSPDAEQRRLKDLARRFLKDSVETSTAVDRVAQHLGDIGASSDASGAGNFVAALIDQRLCVGIEIVHRVIADADSALVRVIGETLVAIRAVDAERALELAQTLVNTGLTEAKVKVAYAYGWGIASVPTVSSAELTLIRELAVDDDVKLARQLSSGLRFMAERDPRIALMVILEMRIGRSEELTAEVLRLFWDAGPLRIDELGKDELDGIVEQLVQCNRIDDYWVQAFLSSLSRSDLHSVVRLLQRRVEHAECLDELDDYRPVPFRWHDKWRLESIGARDRRRVLEELREWAAKDVPGWRRRNRAPHLFAIVASKFDDEALRVIELGLRAPAAIAANVANLLSEVPRDFAWSHVQWVVRTLDDAWRRDAEVYVAITDALYSALGSGVHTRSHGQPSPEFVKQCAEARKVADGLPRGSPGERFYRSVQRAAEHRIELDRERDEDWA